MTAVEIAQLGRRHNLLDDFRIRHGDKKVIASYTMSVFGCRSFR